MFMKWLRFFRIVNLPTVPGDVLVGASVVTAVSSACGARPPSAAALGAACLVSVLMYMFGLAQNDILGAKTDVGRPIPEGLISLGQAKTACALCWVFAGLISSYPWGRMPLYAWAYLSVMTGLVSAYNVTKRPLLMGLCRGVNLMLGAAVALSALEGAVLSRPLWVATGLGVLWTAYIAAVTKYSEGEEADAAKKRCVGLLIGALVYLQLIVLIVAYLHAPGVLTRGALLGGAAMLIVLRFLKRILPEVSAS